MSNTLERWISNPTIENRNALIMENAGLIRYTIRRLRVHPRSHQDAFQEGVIGFIRALSTFDPKISKLNTYAFFHIRSSIQKWMERQGREELCIQTTSAAIRNALRSKIPSAELVSRRVPLPEERYLGSNDNPEDRISAVEASRIAADAIAKVKLGIREKQIMQECLLDDRPLSEISSKFGVSKQRISQIKKLIIDNIKVEAFGSV